MDFKLFVKRGNKFFEIFKTPPIEWCRIVGGKTHMFSIQKIMLKSLQSSAAKLIHACPYQGVYKAYNISISKDSVQIIPTGFFKVNIKIHDAIDSNIAFFNASVEIFNYV